MELTGSAEQVVSIADSSAPASRAPASGVRISGQEEDVPAALALASQLFTEGVLTIPVQQTHPLEQAAQARAVSQAGHVRGRLVIQARPDR